MPFSDVTSFSTFHQLVVSPEYGLQLGLGHSKVQKSLNVSIRYNKMLRYRRETALQGALEFSPKVEDWNWETIFYEHYRSIFNHCDIIG